MSNEPNWIKAQKLESGNFPTSSFKDVLTAMYPTYNENLNATVLQLDFQSGKTYNIPCFSKDKQWGIHEDGTYDSFNAIGQFLASIERLDRAMGLPTDDENPAAHIQLFFAWLDGELTGIKTDPDIVGKTLHNVARPRQVGDATQTPKYPDWTIGQIDGLTATVPKPKGRPTATAKGKATAASAPAQTTDITGIVLDALGDSASISEVFTALGKKYKVSELRAALETLKAQGVVIESAGKYQVV